jgi:hypothetical protein
VQARPAGWWERRRRWLRRRPDLAAVLGASLVVAVVLLSLLLVQIYRAAKTSSALNQALATARANREEAEAHHHAAERLEGEAERARAEAVRRRAEAGQLLYVANIRAADAAWQSGDMPLFSNLLDRHAATHGNGDVRGFEWYVLNRRRHVSSQGNQPPAGGVIDSHVDLPWLKEPARHVNGQATAAESPDGRWQASAGEDRCILLSDKQTGDLLHTLIGHLGFVNDLTFVGTDRLVSAGSDGTVRVWHVPLGTELCCLRRTPADPCRRLAVSPDGHWLALVLHSGQVEVMNISRP